MLELHAYLAELSWKICITTENPFKWNIFHNIEYNIGKFGGNFPIIKKVIIGRTWPFRVYLLNFF